MTGIGVRTVARQSRDARARHGEEREPESTGITDSGRRLRATPLSQVQILSEGAKLQIEAVADVDDHCLTCLDRRLLPHREKDFPVLAQRRARIRGLDRGEDPE